MVLHPTYRPITLCEVCARATGRCHWSKKGDMRPVPGWDAIRSDVRMQTQARETNRFIESYIVLSCPLFELQEHYRWAYERFEPDKIRDKGGKRSGGNSVQHKKVRCLDTGTVYPSVKDASAKTGNTEYSIRAACTGLTKKTREGTRWEYITEETS